MGRSSSSRAAPACAHNRQWYQDSEQIQPRRSDRSYFNIRTTSEQAQQLAGGHEFQLLLELAVIFSR